MLPPEASLPEDMDNQLTPRRGERPSLSTRKSPLLSRLLRRNPPPPRGWDRGCGSLARDFRALLSTLMLHSMRPASTPLDRAIPVDFIATAPTASFRWHTERAARSSRDASVPKNDAPRKPSPGVAHRAIAYVSGGYGLAAGANRSVDDNSQRVSSQVAFTGPAEMNRDGVPSISRAPWVTRQLL